jgi:hypothetical protein
VQQDCETSFSGAAAADELLRYSSLYVGWSAHYGANRVWLTRESLLEEMYTHASEENGPADPAQGIVSGWRDISGGDLDRADSGLQWLLITHTLTTLHSDP